MSVVSASTNDELDIGDGTSLLAADSTNYAFLDFSNVSLWAYNGGGGSDMIAVTDGTVHFTGEIGTGTALDMQVFSDVTVDFDHTEHLSSLLIDDDALVRMNSFGRERAGYRRLHPLRRCTA